MHREQVVWPDHLSPRLESRSAMSSPGRISAGPRRSKAAAAGDNELMGAGRPHGPLPVLLVGLTVVTGLVDAFSYLSLEHVFVANMVGARPAAGTTRGDARRSARGRCPAALREYCRAALARRSAADLLCRDRPCRDPAPTVTCLAVANPGVSPMVRRQDRHSHAGRAGH
jgi:hypothetical protein